MDRSAPGRPRQPCPWGGGERPQQVWRQSYFKGIKQPLGCGAVYGDWQGCSLPSPSGQPSPDWGLGPTGLHRPDHEPGAGAPSSTYAWVGWEGNFFYVYICKINKIKRKLDVSPVEKGNLALPLMYNSQRNITHHKSLKSTKSSDFPPCHHLLSPTLEGIRPVAGRKRCPLPLSKLLACTYLRCFLSVMFLYWLLGSFGMWT